MELTYFVTEFQTGLIVGQLPLHGVTLNSAIRQPGSMSAKLDLRRIAKRLDDGSTYQWTDAQRTLDILKHGRHTIVPAIENSTAGTLDPVDLALGEWWITGTSGSHADPVVTIEGHEVGDYFNHATNSRKWDSDGANVDAAWTARELMHDATKLQTPPIAVDLLRGSTSALTAVTRWPARSIVVADALRELGAGDTWEWTIKPTIVSVNGVPDRVERELLLMAPRIAIGDPDLLPLEILTPGLRPATGLDVGWSEDIESRATEMWSWGAGSGDDQVRSGVVNTPSGGMPVLSRLVTDPSAKYGPMATVLARDALAAMQRVPFTVVVDASRMVPTIGGLRWVSRQPSLSMPTGEEFNARVMEWSWTEPQPGETDVFAVTMERA